jgi:hypothetical protein
VSERPILFSAPMVQALLAGRKTQTRRTMKIQPPASGYQLARCESSTAKRDEGRLHWIKTSEDGYRVEDGKQPYFDCPYGKPGDRLWVKEGFVIQHDVEGEELPFSDGRPVLSPTEEDAQYVNWSWQQPHYRATDPMPELVCCKKSHRNCDVCINPWITPLFMPRWASRITLEITEVRVQRLQEISEEDAIAEGCTDGGCNNCGNSSWPNPCGCASPEPLYVDAYAHLWESINGAGSWNLNPWVWCVSFAATSSPVVKTGGQE